MAVLKYQDPDTGEWLPISQYARGPQGDPGVAGGPIDDLDDVTAPSNTPAGKVLGTTAEGAWGPVDALLLSGGVMAGAIDMAWSSVENAWLTETHFLGGIPEQDGGDIFLTNSMYANGHTLYGVANPSSDDHVASKGYVDSRIWTGTQAEYDGLTPDPDILYVVTG